MHGTLMRKARVVKSREPNGRIQREREPAPTAVRRLMDAGLIDVRHAEWGTELGRLLLVRSITETMYAAGKRWAEMASKYQKSIGVFPVRTTSVETGRAGSPPDPDTSEGQRIARREANQAEDFFAADATLVQAGPRIRIVVRRACEDNEMPCGVDELILLRAGLLRLASHWGLTNASKSGVMSDRHG